ncbi:MAG TPA: YeeE/YedE thiosulfate transporter family protein [Paracoccaceae bacterium]|nr:YeeE/YedE thiosulfate transporter family protein [Paracoccaceae bacterium]HMO70774.1 YeeE/YedE thiosulfate transporter family protein [Paracoccaceae bacterium]
MFAEFGFETLTPRTASVVLGLLVGLVFGILAERSGFCLRRGLVGPAAERPAALGLWALALAAAVLGTQGATATGWIGFADHRFLSPDLPVLAVLAGGAMFGAGMVLTRGCASRLTVLSGTGNLRAVMVLIVFAAVAHAAMKGVLAPLRTALASVTLPLGGALPVLAAAAIVAGALALAWRGRLGPAQVAAGLAIGALVPLAWVGTGLVLADDFDPIPMEALSFTQPAADTLFWAIASTAIAPAFGVGLFLGTLGGAALVALAAGSFRWQSFSTPRETGRYGLGAVLMGFGGVSAGGCTLGAGLSGIPTLSVTAALTLAAIAAGAVATDRLLGRAPSAAGRAAAAPATTRQA